MTIKDFCVDALKNSIIWNHESEDSEMSLQPHIDFERSSLGILTPKQQYICQNSLLLTVISIKDLT